MNVRFWKGTLAAFVVAVLIKAVVEMWWIPTNLASVFPGSPPRTNLASQWMLGIAVAAVITFVAIYVMAEFLEKLARAQNRQPLKHGAQFGLVFGLAQSAWMFLLPVASAYMMMHVALNLVSNVVAFAAAGWVYQRLDPGPIVRGEHHKQYLQQRKRL